MGHRNGQLEHDEFKRNLDRLSAAANTEFEKASVTFFEGFGTWMRKTHNAACDAKDSAQDAHNKIKIQSRGIKIAAGILGIVVLALTVFNIFLK